MKSIISLLTIFLISGCSGADSQNPAAMVGRGILALGTGGVSEMIREDAANKTNKYKTTCKEYGFKEGTRDFRGCLMELDTADRMGAQARAAKPKSNFTCTTTGNTTNCN
jgi:hypothetical protein